jgi:hypothetical protein
MSTAKEFKMQVFTRRFQHHDTYSIKMTPTGWEIRHQSVGGNSDRTGSPGLAQCFDQDNVSYPANLGEYFGKIWQLLDSKEITDAEAQRFFDRLGSWVSTYEKGTPDDIYEIE